MSPLVSASASSSADSSKSKANVDTFIDVESVNMTVVPDPTSSAARDADQEDGAEQIQGGGAADFPPPPESSQRRKRRSLFRLYK